ncbi:hypothetical protein O3P69_014381 [Scylla paramamosain]|uniref:Uncharacterized protein n=1 Tax=Scylla paramamosain TaxID=85552 RepID=A0AAW0TB37_SCYPA
MNTILPVLILVLGSVLDLTHAQTCTHNKTLRSGDSKTIHTDEITYNHGMRMSIKVDKLYPCEDFLAVILEVEETNGIVHKAEFLADGKCWEKKTERKKLQGEVILYKNPLSKNLSYHLTVGECMLNFSEEIKGFTGFLRINIVGHGQSLWCTGVEDPPKKLKPPPLPFKCHSAPPSHNISPVVSRAKVLVIVGWVVGGLVVVVTVVVTVVVVWCVCRRSSSQSPVARWRRPRGEQPPSHSHVSDNNMYEPFSNSRGGRRRRCTQGLPTSQPQQLV